MPEQRGCGRWGRGCSGMRLDDFQGWVTEHLAGSWQTRLVFTEHKLSIARLRLEA